MSQAVELAKNRLFGSDDLRVTNIKLFPGTKRDVSIEALATELNKSLSRIKVGDVQPIEMSEDH